MRALAALLKVFWYTDGVLRGCWDSEFDHPDGIGLWTYSALWRSRER